MKTNYLNTILILGLTVFNLVACQSQPVDKEGKPVSTGENEQAPQPTADPNEAQRAIENQAGMVKNNPELSALQPEPAPRKAPTLTQTPALKPIEKVEADYPLSAVKNAQEGWVLLTFNTDEKGHTSQIKVLDSSPKKIFDKAAVKALSQWRYIETGNTNQQVLIEFGLTR